MLGLRTRQVCGVYGSWHLGKLTVGLSRAVRLARCRSCRLVLREALPVQVDGEPWRQPPATLDVSFKGQVCTCCARCHSAWSPLTPLTTAQPLR